MRFRFFVRCPRLLLGSHRAATTRRQVFWLVPARHAFPVRPRLTSGRNTSSACERMGHTAAGLHRNRTCFPFHRARKAKPAPREPLSGDKDSANEWKEKGKRAAIYVFFPECRLLGRSQSSASREKREGKPRFSFLFRGDSVQTARLTPPIGVAPWITAGERSHPRTGTTTPFRPQGGRTSLRRRACGGCIAVSV